MGCIACGRGLNDECLSDPKCQPSKGISFLTPEVKRTPKEISEINDPLSTWRKRAAIQYPLQKGFACEWKGLANTGGGKYPIVGCKNGEQETIHHGPVKIGSIEYDFNQKENIHRICQICHHLWHHWNDAPYVAEQYAVLQHTPHEATKEELELWSSAKTRPKAPEPRTKPMNVGVD